MDWATFDSVLTNEGGCTMTEFQEFLESPMLRGIVVQNHQVVFHEKVMTFPLGLHWSNHDDIWEVLERLRKKYPAKVRLLFINNSCYRFRKEIVKDVEDRLGIYNNYGVLSKSQFSIAVASSKFVLCPPGLGMDCYRIWCVVPP